MKKIISIMLSIFTIAALFTGCTSNTPDSSSSSDIEVVSNEPNLDENAYRIGIAQFAAHPSLDNCREGFIKGLEEEGLVEGKNLVIDYQNSQADVGIANQIADSFATSDTDLICAIATPMAQASYNSAESKDIPVVYSAVSDPVAAKLDNSNGDMNITGTSDKLPVEEQLRLIRALMPNAKTIGIMYSTSEVNSESTIAEYKELAGNYGFTIVDSGISAVADVPLATDDLLTKVDCITNITDNTVVSALAVILDKANSKHIPVFGSEIEQVKNGCVAAAGIEYIELGKQTGKMAAKILKGEMKASEMPYETIENSSIYINSDLLEQYGMKYPEEYKDKAIDVKQGE